MGIFYKTLLLLFTRFKPSKKTMMHTAEPVARFIICISVLLIPSKDTSIDRWRENIDTKPSAKDKFLRVMILGDLLFLDFIRFIAAIVIFVNAYSAMVIIVI